jgi:hypothetical protein
MVRRLPLAQVYELPAPEHDAMAASSALSAAMQSANAPDIILPLDDTGLWVMNAANVSPARIAGASGDQVRLALDKTRQIAAAEQAGFALPETRVVRSARDLSAPLQLPAIAKPALAVNLADGRLVKPAVTYLPDQAAVETFATSLPDSADLNPLLVQPLIAGQGEGIFGFANLSGVSHWSGHRRLRMMNPHGSGSSACVSQMPEANLLAAADAFVTASGWRGPFMIEILRDVSGTPWFMELNGRMWGSMALARAQGFEYPAWAVAQALDSSFQPPCVNPSGGSYEARHLGRDMLHLLFVLRGPRNAFYRDGWPRLVPTLAAVLHSNKSRRIYNRDSNFPAFHWYDALHTLRTGLRRRG